MGLEQYHNKLARELEGVTNANCMAHARRHFANATRAIGKGNEKAIKSSIAYKALVRIGAIYKLEGALKGLTAEFYSRPEKLGNDSYSQRSAGKRGHLQYH